MRLWDTTGQLRSGLDYHLTRQNVLSTNLANVDTPGFRARDVERINPFDREMNVALRATDSSHIGTDPTRAVAKIFRPQDMPPDADGNNVNLDKEVVKMTSNHVRYETIGNLVAHELAILAWAANDGRGA